MRKIFRGMNESNMIGIEKMTNRMNKLRNVSVLFVGSAFLGIIVDDELLINIMIKILGGLLMVTGFVIGRKAIIKGIEKTKHV